MTIQEIDLLIKHRSGKSNTNADALSRNPVDLNPSDTNMSSCKDVTVVDPRSRDGSHPAQAQPKESYPRTSSVREREHNSGDGDQPKESLPKQSERERSRHSTSSLSSEVGESLPKSSFNPHCYEDGVAVSNMEASAYIEKKE